MIGAARAHTERSQSSGFMRPRLPNQHSDHYMAIIHHIPQSFHVAGKAVMGVAVSANQEQLLAKFQAGEWQQTQSRLPLMKEYKGAISTMRCIPSPPPFLDCIIRPCSQFGEMPVESPLASYLKRKERTRILASEYSCSW